MFTLAASSYMLLLLALFFIGGMAFAFVVIWLAAKSTTPARKSVAYDPDDYSGAM